MKTILKGDIWYVDLPSNGDNLQSGRRPAIIVSNNIANKFSPVIQVVALTTKMAKAKIPTHVHLRVNESFGIKQDSIALCEQIISINKKNLVDKIGLLDEKNLRRIDEAMSLQLQIERNIETKPVHTEEKLDRLHIEKSRKHIDNLVEAYKILKTEDMKESIMFSVLELKKYCMKHRINYNLYIGKYEEFLPTREKFAKVAI
ncbi:MAG: type II toxin-antitoxin system PemK/MazF family toxin [Veillonella parvula]|uniref:Type II toxin-antitoxin system PemK/MazF family toxin n=1 Tax=Veillonella parvula TaxID=29466 RepID=A0A942WX28_VEIPA|nr:type II toxin-antitoxin system PemK/MazF family toxin [Veillonella parvula]MBS4893795.1 type II toxin-antitoxin system PemK/MazF family toxin [Veillonella parvula]